VSTLPFYWVDAFTDRPFGGNPAAVVPLERWLPDAELQRLAAQHNLSETAYFVPEGASRHHLRWFTPAVEVDLCGHATLATAHILFHERNEPGRRLTFATRSGPLHVERGEQGMLAMDFPSRPSAPAAGPPELAAALGAAPVHVGRTDSAWLCVLASAEQVRALRPDHAALARLRPGRFIVTAPGGADGVDFVSRFFAPDAGIAEDPVTGSAHCVLTPYWAERLGEPSLHALQVSARGGELWCELAGDRVRIAGRAFTYIKGELRL
jgi:PhzF family phenazine biosynthesis protein